MQEGTSETSTKDGVESKKKRKQVRAKITRCIKRLNEEVMNEDKNIRRFQKEMEQLRKDFEIALELHSQLYDSSDVDNNVLDKWEDDLTNDVYGIEEKVEEYMRNISNPSSDLPQSQALHAPPETSQSSSHVSTPEPTASGTQASVSGTQASESGSQQETQGIPSTNAEAITTSTPKSFDAWIDELTEFEETKIATPQVDGSQLSIAEALLKLEARRDVPNITLTKFSGNPLEYVDYIDRFKTHIHDKAHLNDDTRMIQLKMHITGDVENAISGLGSKGIMYATALKTIKEQFGQPSAIARTVINNLTKGEKIGRSDRRKLREFSIDLLNCMATMKRIGYSADINANENLRRIIMRLPDQMIEKWRVVVASIRENGQVPSVSTLANS